MNVEFEDLDPVIFPRDKKNCASCVNIDKKGICARSEKHRPSAVITLCGGYGGVVGAGAFQIKKDEDVKPVVNSDNDSVRICRNCLHSMYDEVTNHYTCCVINGHVAPSERCNQYKQ